ncbi:hypothetical protein GCM10022199_04950 [Marihabitans asiaticum]|uniref:Iron uptake system component EfeO n=1 Tax=Marihabitans asiaticum TaxID=415218 RepID=A0A560WED8_9MICO|nr:iron uptake system protein EfeO [Marihabitans asiaticum]TWD15835.1 iron uptake system component EfeO [Marihabitans asiaticum]
MARTTRAAVALTFAAALALTACGNDDGGQVTNLGSETGSASGSGAGSGSGSGSGSGLGSDLQQDTDNAKVAEAVEQYQAYVQEQAETMATATTTFTDAVRAGDLKAAQQAYAPSREPWERIEPIAGLIEELDGRMDARVDDFESPTDEEFTGWHRLEYLLFEKETTDGAKKFADQLDEDVATLQDKLGSLEIPAAAVPVGASELIDEVSMGKITGEEDRYSQTDLWDLGANVEGSKKAFDLLTPALKEADPDLASKITDQFAEVEETLAPLKDGDGWKLYCLEGGEYNTQCGDTITVDTTTKDQLQSQTQALAENLSQMAGALGLES